MTPRERVRLQANMPADNVLALFAVGREYGMYPIDARRISEAITREKHGNPV